MNSGAGALFCLMGHGLNSDSVISLNALSFQEIYAFLGVRWGYHTALEADCVDSGQ